MPWQSAQFPRQPRGECTVVTVNDAIVTPVQRGLTASAVAPSRWMRGAVHTADGDLVPESQRMWAGDNDAPVATDPDQLRSVPRAPLQLRGTWLYGGHFMPPFGHFVLETLSTLWPEVDGLTGLLFHHGYRAAWDKVPSRDVPLTPWQEDLFALAGHGAPRKHEVLRRAMRVERLLVPTRPMVFKAWALPEVTHPWQRVGAAAGGEPGTDRCVFLSRAEFNRARRAAGPSRFLDRSDQEHDDRLDRAMADLGVRVVEPQTLSIREQVRLVRGADVLVASSGSALHLSAFARPDARVIELGDVRTRTAPLAAQQVVDAAYDRSTAFVPLTSPDEIATEVAGLLDRL